MASNILLATVLFLLSKTSLGANILFLEGVNSPSHHVWTRELINSLVEKGHNLTSLSYHVDTDQPNKLTYIHMDTLLVYNSVDWYWNYNELNIISRTFAYESNRNNIFMKTIETEGFKALLNYPEDFQFDLIIYDHLAHPGFFVFVAKFDCPIISASASPDITGAPSYPFFMLHDFNSHVDDFWSRLCNFVNFAVKLAVKEWYLYPNVDLFIKKIIPQSKSIKEIESSVKLSLVNYHPVFNSVQPLMPSVIPVGGLQITVANPLVEDLKVIYTRAKQGVVYFSLGSHIQSESLGQPLLTEIIKAFKDLPDYTFLWKLNATHLDLDIPSNVFLRPWLPQRDILADNRTLLFVTNCGSSSFLESVWLGVPMLVLPVSMDQQQNAERVVKMGVGLKLDLEGIKRDALRSTILELLTNPNFQISAQNLSRFLNDQPERPLERALGYIEHTLRYPDVTYLQNGQMKSFSQAFMLSIDILLFVILVLFIMLWVFCFVLKWIIQRFVGMKLNKIKTQ